MYSKHLQTSSKNNVNPTEKQKFPSRPSDLLAHYSRSAETATTSKENYYSSDKSALHSFHGRDVAATASTSRDGRGVSIFDRDTRQQNYGVLSQSEYSRGKTTASSSNSRLKTGFDASRTGYSGSNEKVDRAHGPSRYEALMVDAQKQQQAKARTEEASGDDSDDDTRERREKRERMDKSYKEIMKTYNRQQFEARKQPKWANLKTRDAVVPDEMTITNVNHKYELLGADGQTVTHSNMQTSCEWLQNHSIRSLRLTLKDLVDRGVIQKPVTDRQSGKLQQHMQFNAQEIDEFAYKLKTAIKDYTNRIQWLLQGSRRLFGLVKGSRVAVIIDASEANLGFGRQGAFSESLVHLFDEQLRDKSSVYLATFGSDVWPLWATPMQINSRTLEEAKQWANRIKPRGGCNLLKALQHVIKLKDIDAVVVLLGSVPDQSAEVLSDYVYQLCIGRDLTIDTVAYDCSNHHTNVALRKLAEQSHGRYHCYSSTVEEQIYTGSDITALFDEIKKAQQILDKIHEMRQGLLGTAIVTIMDEISSEVAKLSAARLLPRPVGHDLPLQIEKPAFHALASSDWLAKQGLKACSLDLYQVLAPNAYSYREEFVPVIRKTVQSQVHERAMAQFVWHDGSMKNIHVDMTQLYDYQKQLGAQVKLYESRIDWLSSASRKIFGSIVEDNVLIMLDISLSNEKYLVHIQHSMRQLLQEQLANKRYFNIIAFGSEVKRFRRTLVRATPEQLQEAWSWVLALRCNGSRNFMAALREAVENDEERQHKIEVEGLYLFTSGIPNQPQEVISSFLQECCSGCGLQLHVVLFNVDDYDASGAIPSRFANITQTAECLRALAHCTGGRFHWFRETGIIESDDIAAVALEIEKALNFSDKAAMLVESVKKKYGMRAKYDEFALEDEMPAELEAPIPIKALPMPRHTALSQTRMRVEPAEDEVVAKPSGWRPSSAVNDSKARPQSGKKKRTQKAFFYTEQTDKRAADYVGSVYDKFARKKSVKKAIRVSNIPDKEEQVTTKEWLQMYSLLKLKLDLTKLVSGPDCRHVSKPVRSLGKRAEAKYCTVFPTINVNGTLKHLQLLPHELLQYEEQLDNVLKRYLLRLQWLLAGSRRVFGTVVERNVVVLIDTSGSMQASMEELKRELTSLVWEQLHKHGCRFNLIRFSSACDRWRDSVQEATLDNCHDAIKWISSLIGTGNTCTLEALKMAFSESDIDAIYLLTDGKPDTSTSLVLKEVATLNSERSVKVNTISFNCDNDTANTFLKMLAAETSGRYHRCHGDFDAERFAHQLLTQGSDDPENPPLPQFEGHDLKRLGQEISMARQYLQQSRTYRTAYEALKTPRDQSHDCFTTIGAGAQPTTVTSSRPKSDATSRKSSRSKKTMNLQSSS